MTAIESAPQFDRPGVHVAAAVRRIETLAEAVTEECCQHVEAALILCRGETSRRAYADEFFAAVHTQVGELGALLLCATSDQPRISPA
ncbi:hypothetical protein [Mycobacteroides abscessus]|uniref:hypothetical protein n=1 Tax=Mycobacteroides abscessus TaxID=36809 RepID=UPI0010572AC9|nr:hypothetical protein [Mycobacteroides abscessus]